MAYGETRATARRPEGKHPNDSYRIEARHIAVVLFQPAWGSTRTGKTRTTNLPETDT